MYYTGFADEAAAAIEGQIAATKELGWSNIEARALYGKNLASISDAEFDDLCRKLDAAEVSINCFGSGVANWNKHPRKQEDFDASMTELRNALPRMRKLGAKLLRGMSFLVPTDERPDSPELEAVIFKKVNELVKVCEDNGILFLHENCMNYGGMSASHTLKLLEHVKSPAFKLVFDTGNPIFTDDRSKPVPHPKQSAWEFYAAVKQFIYYIHIKDGIWDAANSKSIFTFPGEGNGDVRRILKDMLKNGYDGGISIEPHMVAIYHDKDNSPEAKAKAMLENYVEYGRRTMRMVDEIRKES